MRNRAASLVLLFAVTTPSISRPGGFNDVNDLQKLAGHLTEDWFITKFRKIFARDEMNDDLSIVPARYHGGEDTSAYEEIPTSSPPGRTRSSGDASGMSKGSCTGNQP